MCARYRLFARFVAASRRCRAAEGFGVLQSFLDKRRDQWLAPPIFGELGALADTALQTFYVTIFKRLPLTCPHGRRKRPRPRFIQSRCRLTNGVISDWRHAFWGVSCAHRHQVYRPLCDYLQ
jgi:hypothetical protein